MEVNTCLIFLFVLATCVYYYDGKYIISDIKGKRKEKSNGGLEINLNLMLCLQIK